MNISSREYKIALRADRFAGNQETCRDVISKFWKRLAFELQIAGISVVGNMDDTDPDKQRELYFIDTLDNDLIRSAGLVYRLRRKLQPDAEWTATLKFRHGDRFLTAAEAFVPDRDEDDVKLEEDVKVEPGSAGLSFRSLYSRSADAKVGSGAGFVTIEDALRPFRSVGKEGLPLTAPIAVVNDLHVVEHVFEGGKLSFGRGSVLSDNCAVILWWRQGVPEDPLAAEFSFRVNLDDGSLAADTARGAWIALRTIGANVYADPAGKTKTALVYD